MKRYKVKYCVINHTPVQTQITIINTNKSTEVDCLLDAINFYYWIYSNDNKKSICVLKNSILELSQNEIKVKGEKVFFSSNSSFKEIVVSDENKYINLDDIVVRKFFFKKILKKGMKPFNVYIEKRTEIVKFRSNSYVIFGDVDDENRS